MYGAIEGIAVEGFKERRRAGHMSAAAAVVRQAWRRGLRKSGYGLYRVVQKRISSFIFGITSVIQHRFYHSFTVTSRNLWRVKVKFLHSPHLYCVITLPSEINTTANIAVLDNSFKNDETELTNYG